MQISSGVMAGLIDFIRIIDTLQTESHVKNFIGLNLVAGRSVDGWSFGFHFKSSRLWLLLTPECSGLEVAGEVTDVLPRCFCGAGMPQSQLSSTNFRQSRETRTCWVHKVHNDKIQTLTLT